MDPLPGRQQTKRAPLRSACDKCHRIKTRCTRDIGAVECKRCIRLGLPCSYSAPLRMGRPRTSNITHNAGDVSAGAAPPPQSRTRDDRGQASQDAAPSPPCSTSSALSCAVPRGASTATDRMLAENGPFTPFSLSLGGSPRHGYYTDVDADGLNLTAPDLDAAFFAAAHHSHANIFDIMMTDASGKDDVSFPTPTPPASGDKHAGLHLTIPSVTPPYAIVEQAPDPRYEDSMYQLGILHLDLYRLGSQPVHPSESVGGMDDVFGATGALTDILRDLASESQDHDKETTQYGQSRRSSTFDGNARTAAQRRPIDTAATLLIHACYLRLLQGYLVVLTRLRHHVVQASTPSTPRSESVATRSARRQQHQQQQQQQQQHQQQQYGQESATGSSGDTTPGNFLLPALNIGSFSLAGLSDLNVGLLLHLTLQMLRRLQTVAAGCFPAKSTRITTDNLLVQDDEGGLPTSMRLSSAGGPYGSDAGGVLAEWTLSPLFATANAALSEMCEKERAICDLLREINTLLGS